MAGGTRTALYRLFNAQDELIYIGISWRRLPTRMQDHADGQPWWDEVDHATAVWYETRKEADEAETEAIKAERPRYNIMKTKPTKAQIALERAQERAQERARIALEDKIRQIWGDRLSDEAFQKLVEIEQMADLDEAYLATHGFSYQEGALIIKRGSFREIMGVYPVRPDLADGVYPGESVWVPQASGPAS